MPKFYKKISLLIVIGLLLNHSLVSHETCLSASATKPSAEPPPEALRPVEKEHGYWRVIDATGKFALNQKFELPAQIYEKQNRFDESEMLLEKLVKDAQLKNDIDSICNALLELGIAQYSHTRHIAAEKTFKLAASYFDRPEATNALGEKYRGAIAAAYSYACLSGQNDFSTSDYWFNKTLAAVEAVKSDGKNCYPWLDGCQTYFETVRRHGSRSKPEQEYKAKLQNYIQRVERIRSMPQIDPKFYSWRPFLFPPAQPGLE